MSTWTTPITWSNAAVTTSQMNSLRDNLLFLKGSLDVISAGTSADTGTTMYLDIRRTNATDPALRSGVSGAANPEFQVGRDGKLSWGAGGASAVDTVVYRGAAGQVYFDHGLTFNGSSGIVLGGNVLEFTERTDPAPGAANTGRLYVRDNGAGKSQLVIIFSSGAVQVIATQP